MSVDAFKPEIWSQELRAAYEKALVFVSLCNRDYEGEIAKASDIVHINTIGDPTVADYVPGTTQISAEELATKERVTRPRDRLLEPGQRSVAEGSGPLVMCTASANCEWELDVWEKE